jgi:hypothetical protein
LQLSGGTPQKCRFLLFPLALRCPIWGRKREAASVHENLRAVRLLKKVLTALRGRRGILLAPHSKRIQNPPPRTLPTFGQDRKLEPVRLEDIQKMTNPEYEEECFPFLGKN